MLLEILDAAAVPIGLIVGFVVARRRRIPGPPEELRCTGGFSTGRDNRGQFTKARSTACKALRSGTCLDGRCTWHCGQLCRCNSVEKWLEK